MNKYRLKLRPASFSTLPCGVVELGWDYVEAPWQGVNRPDLPRSTSRYGVIITPFKVTSDDLDRFAMELV